MEQEEESRYGVTIIAATAVCGSAPRPPHRSCSYSTPLLLLLLYGSSAHSLPACLRENNAFCPAMNSAVRSMVPSVLPSQPLKMYFKKSSSPPRQVEKDLSDDEDELLPLPDVVLCSALSASMVHGERIRERRRHKATIQTKGREHMEQLNLGDMMEPLVRSLEGLLQNNISMNPDPSETEDKDDVDCVYHTKRRRTISSTSTATATKLSTLSAVVVSSQRLKKNSLTIEDTPEGVFNGLKNLFKNVFAN